MAGCFGNSAEDKWKERQTLLEDDFSPNECEKCGADEDSYGGLVIGDFGRYLCPECYDWETE